MRRLQMLRWMLVCLLSTGLLGGCGDDGGSGGAASIGVVEGAYVGDVSLATDVPEDSIFASAEIEVASDGTISGRVTTKSPTAVVGEIGELTGSMSKVDVASFDADLALEFPGLGTFSAAGTLAFSESSGILAGQLSARDASGALVGSTIVSVHQE